MFHRRTVPLTLVLLGLMLSACSSSQPAPPNNGPQVVRDRLAAADDAPYSAALRAITQSGPRRLQLMEGRVNLNAPFTGRTTDTTEQYTEDVVITRQKVYRRATGTHGPWQEFPASAAKGVYPRTGSRSTCGSCSVTAPPYTRTANLCAYRPALPRRTSNR